MQWFTWKQGEHITLVGPTGSGKSMLIEQLLERRKFVVVLATKKRDATIERLRKEGFKFTSNWDQVNAEMTPHIVYRPPFPNVSATELRNIHSNLFADILTSIFRQGGWTVVADEVRYLTEFLRLKNEMELLWLQGRSLGISVVAATQRPANIPLTAYDQATHLFFWRDNDETNLKRIGGLGGLSAKDIRHEVAILGRHEVLYLNTRTGEGIRTKVAL